MGLRSQPELLAAVVIDLSYMPLGGVSTGGAEPTEVVDFEVVAGVGFEPTAFRL